MPAAVEQELCALPSSASPVSSSVQDSAPTPHPRPPCSIPHRIRQVLVVVAVPSTLLRPGRGRLSPSPEPASSCRCQQQQHCKQPWPPVHGVEPRRPGHLRPRFVLVARLCSVPAVALLRLSLSPSDPASPCVPGLVPASRSTSLTPVLVHSTLAPPRPVFDPI